MPSIASDFSFIYLVQSQKVGGNANLNTVTIIFHIIKISGNELQFYRWK